MGGYVVAKAEDSPGVYPLPTLVLGEPVPIFHSVGNQAVLLSSPPSPVLHIHITLLFHFSLSVRSPLPWAPVKPCSFAIQINLASAVALYSPSSLVRRWAASQGYKLRCHEQHFEKASDVHLEKLSKLAFGAWHAFGCPISILSLVSCSVWPHPSAAAQAAHLACFAPHSDNTADVCHSNRLTRQVQPEPTPLFGQEITRDWPAISHCRGLRVSAFKYRLLMISTSPLTLK